MQIGELLLHRWRPEWDSSGFKRGKTQLDRIVALHDDLRRQQAALEQNEHLTPLGRRDALQKYIGEKLAPELRRSASSVSFMREKIAHRRKQLLPSPPDKTDVAAAVLRADARAVLRNESLAAKANLLLAEDADPMMRMAVLEAPNALSGINEQIRSEIVSAYVERTYPAMVSALEQAEQAVDLIEVARHTALNAVKLALGFPNDTVLADFVTASLGDRGHRIDVGVSQEFADFDVAA